MMRGLMPWPGYSRVDRERLLERIAEEMSWDDLSPLTDWVPPLEILETKDSLVVRLEVPGLEQKDIGISLQTDRLTIRGEKRREPAEPGERAHRVERAFGVFARTVRLAVAIDTQGATATMRNGVLTVMLRKAPSVRRATISIGAH